MGHLAAEREKGEGRDGKRREAEGIGGKHA